MNRDKIQMIKDYYCTIDKETKRPKIYPGRNVQARIIAVHEQELIIDVFGIECIVEAINVSWLIIEDLRDKYSEGDTIIVTVTNVIYPEEVIDKNSPEYLNGITISVSGREFSLDRTVNTPNEHSLLELKILELINTYGKDTVANATRKLLTRNEEDDERIRRAADLYVREEDKQIRSEIDELNEFIKCSQKNYNEGGLPTEQTLKDFLESKKGNAY